MSAQSGPTLQLPPSAPTFRTSFVPSRSSSGIKRCPPPLGFLPPVPSSPIPSSAPVREQRIPAWIQTESQKPAPPLHLRNSQKIPFPDTKATQAPSALSTPSQTLFVFRLNSSLATRMPSTITLTSNGTVPFPVLSTPCVSTFHAQGRARSFIGLGAPPTPTTACSHVDVKGSIGMK